MRHTSLLLLVNEAMEAVWILGFLLLTACSTTGIWSSDVQQRRILLRNDWLKEMMVHLEANKVKAGLNKFLHHQLDGTKMAIKDKMAGAETAMVAHNETVDNKPVVAPKVAVLAPNMTAHSVLVKAHGHNVLKPVAAHKTAADVVVAVSNVAAHHVAVGASNVTATNVVVSANNVVAHNLVAHAHNIRTPATASDEAAAPNMTAPSVLEARGHNVLKPVAAPNVTASNKVAAHNKMALDEPTAAHGLKHALVRILKMAAHVLQMGAHHIVEEASAGILVAAATHALKAMAADEAITVPNMTSTAAPK